MHTRECALHAQVGMHGAALTYALYMPGYGGVLELWPKDHDMWRCFEHISAMSGLQYARWENRNPANFFADDRGDYTRVGMDEFASMFAQLVAGVRQRRVAHVRAPAPVAPVLVHEGE